MTTVLGAYNPRQIRDRINLYQKLLMFKPHDETLDKKNPEIDQIQQDHFHGPAELPPDDDDEKLAEPDPYRVDVAAERDAAWEFGIQHGRASVKKDAIIAERNSRIRKLQSQLQKQLRQSGQRSVAPSPPDQSPSVRAPGSEFFGGSTTSVQPSSSETFTLSSIFPNDPMREDIPTDPESLEVVIPPTGKYRTTPKSKLKKRDAERAKRKHKT